ncbi:MAG: hypothetical protein CW336_00695 [Bacteroidetes bacterium]|nr:hypothetical protein [Bacteroidota bacterium]
MLKNNYNKIWAAKLQNFKAQSIKKLTSYQQLRFLAFQARNDKSINWLIKRGLKVHTKNVVISNFFISLRH